MLTVITGYQEVGEKYDGQENIISSHAKKN
jgi:hypothetical protein